MKICILGDTHFGMRGDSLDFHNHIEKFYTNVFFPYLKENNINTVFQMGDLFDRRKFINFNSLYMCRKYFFDKLQENNFIVRYIHPNLLFISWNHWVPSYVRNEIKKKTGIVVDGNGKRLNDNSETSESNNNILKTEGDNIIFNIYNEIFVIFIRSIYSYKYNISNNINLSIYFNKK